jgi:hypothetical protein
MRQKYVISKNDENDALTIKEFAEVDKELFSLLCEETFDGESVESAISAGKERLIAALRTANLYPPGAYADKIAEAVMKLYGPEEPQSMEIFFDDKEILAKSAEERQAQADIEAETVEIDELLAEDADEKPDESEGPVAPSIIIAKDDSLGVDEDV